LNEEFFQGFAFDYRADPWKNPRRKGKEKMDLLTDEVKVKVLAVVQRLDPRSGVWHDEGQTGDVTPENFERAARKCLRMYRTAHPKNPRKNSRVTRRIVTIADEPMEW
jgi:hypothetical protein